MNETSTIGSDLAESTSSYVVLSRSGVRRLILTAGERASKEKQPRQRIAYRQAVAVMLWLSARRFEEGYTVERDGYQPFTIPPGCGQITWEAMQRLAGPIGVELWGLMLQCGFFSVVDSEFYPLDMQDQCSTIANAWELGYGINFGPAEGSRSITTRPESGEWFSMFRHDAIAIAEDLASAPCRLSVLLYLLTQSSDTKGGIVSLPQGTIAKACYSDRSTVNKAIKALEPLGVVKTGASSGGIVRLKIDRKLYAAGRIKQWTAAKQKQERQEQERERIRREFNR